MLRVCSKICGLLATMHGVPFSVHGAQWNNPYRFPIRRFFHGARFPTRLIQRDITYCGLEHDVVQVVRICFSCPVVRIGLERHHMSARPCTVEATIVDRPMFVPNSRIRSRTACCINFCSGNSSDMSTWECH